MTQPAATVVILAHQPVDPGEHEGPPLWLQLARQALAARGAEHVVVFGDRRLLQQLGPRDAQRMTLLPADHPPDLQRPASHHLHRALSQLQQLGHAVAPTLVLLTDLCPLVHADDIDGTLDALARERADSALAVAPTSGELWHYTADGRSARLDTEHADQGAPAYVDTGAVYALDAAGFREAAQCPFGRVAMHVLPPHRALRLPQLEPAVAAALLRHRSRRDRLAALPQTVGAVTFDFDGVFTDNLVHVRDDGHESVSCNRSDGLGISRFSRLGIPMMVLSAETNPVVKRRCEKLKLPCVQGFQEKWPHLQRWLDEQNVPPEQAIFVGNDANDVPCMQRVACGIAPADAHPWALAAADIVLHHPGGHGAVREVTELVLEKLGRLDVFREHRDA